MKKILYLHGLESEPGGTKVSFLATKGAVYAPEMDYKTLDLEEFIEEVQEEGECYLLDNGFDNAECISIFQGQVIIEEKKGE